MVSFKAHKNIFIIISIIIWIVNDIYLKKYFGNILTGKISDIASIFVMPFTFTYIFFTLNEYLKIKIIPEKYIFYFSLSFISIIFIIINVDQNTNNHFTEFFWGQNCIQGTSDLTDLFCLFSLIPAFLLFHHLENYPNYLSIKIIPHLGLILSFFATVNTSGPKPERNDAMNIIYLLDPRDKITLILPINSQSFVQNEVSNFEWKYVGYDGNNNPIGNKKTNDNDAIMCLKSEKLSALNNQTSNFKNYVLEIATDINFLNIKLITNTTNSSIPITLNLNPGNYYWRIAILLQNISNCPEADVIIYLPVEEKSFKIN